MGVLDDLKKRAGALQARQHGDRQALERSIQLVEAAATGARDYLRELAANLDVIRPQSPVRYVLDKQVVVERLPLTDFRYDARRTIVHEREVLDHIVVFCHVRSGRAVRLAKNFVNETDLLERRLEQAAIEFERKAVRQHETGKLLEVQYAFVADVQLCMRIDCHHDSGTLHVTARNLDGLETVDCDLPAHLLTQARLDELARWWLGEPNAFLTGAAGVRRREAR